MAVGSVNATAASLLGFLHWTSMSGWDVVRVAEQTIGDFWSLTPSQVYRELSALADAGLVTAGERGSRDRRTFTITEAGRTAFEKWVSREPAAETIRFPLLLTLLFGARVPGARRAEFVAAHRARHAATLARYREQLAAAQAALNGGDPGDAFAMATLDFGLRYETAVLEWFDALTPEVRGEVAPG